MVEGTSITDANRQLGNYAGRVLNPAVFRIMRTV